MGEIERVTGISEADKDMRLFDALKIQTERLIGLLVTWDASEFCDT